MIVDAMAIYRLLFLLSWFASLFRHCLQDVTALQEHDNNSLHVPGLDFLFHQYLAS